MKSEVAVYDSYLRGECYGFELYKTASCRIAAGVLSGAWRMPAKQWRITSRTAVRIW